VISRQRLATWLWIAAPPPTATRKSPKSMPANSGSLISALNSVFTPDIQVIFALRMVRISRCRSRGSGMRMFIPPNSENDSKFAVSEKM